MTGPREARLCLVCSSGGHFYELISLSSLWTDRPRTWVTFRAPDTESRLAGEAVIWAHQPTNRHLGNFVRNFALALRTLRRDRPDLIISTGAGVSVSFIYAARLLGIPSIYIESLTRVRRLSLSGRLVYPVVDHLFVQWPDLAARYKKAEFRGQVG
jgi:UDP-N-acetylglucosamine:LPS N-acetylglucosamine transferase